MVTGKMRSSCILWIISLFIDLALSANCASLTISCNTGSTNCYASSAPQCGIFASHMVGRNRLPPTPTSAPTIYMISSNPTKRPTFNPISGPNRLPTAPQLPTSPTNHPIATKVPTNHPITTKTPTNNPITSHPTAAPTNDPTTLEPTTRPTDGSPPCTTCDCDCSLCEEIEHCMLDGPNCFWFSRLTPSCAEVPIYTNRPTSLVPNQPTKSTTAAPTTLSPSTATPTTLSPTITPPTSTTLTPTTPMTVLPISCATHFINGLYSDNAVIFELNLSVSKTVIFDACHSDLVPIIRLFDDSTNQVLNQCNLVNGCCALMEHDSGLSTDLLPGLYRFEFGFDPQDRQRFNRDYAIWHIHIDCHDVNITSPADGTTPAQIITTQPTHFPTIGTIETLSPTTNSQPTSCNLCSCDCSLCIEPEQCMGSGPSCIWLRSSCIQIASSPTTTTLKPSVTPTTFTPTKIPTTNTPTSSPLTALPTTSTCPQLGEQCTSAHHKDVRCCNGNRQLGYARCYYMEYDAQGHKIGTCCVRANRPGCTKDADCCGNKRGCYDGFCLVQPQGSGTSAIHISENGEYAEWVMTFDDDDGKVFGLSRASRIVGIIVLVIFVGCNMIYCYFKYCRKRKREDEDDSDAETNIEDVSVVRI